MNRQERDAFHRLAEQAGVSLADAFRHGAYEWLLNRIADRDAA